MPVTVICEDCGKKYAVPDTTIGKRVKCKQCGHAFVAKAEIARPKIVAKTAGVGTVGTGRAVAASAKARTPSIRVKAPVVVVPEPEEDEYRFKDDPVEDDWSKLESAAVAAPAQVAEAPAFGNANPAIAATMQYLKVGVDAGRWVTARCSGHTLVLLAAMLLAILFAVVAVPFPAAVVGAIFFFPVAALLYFFVGLILLAGPVLRTPGQLKLPVGDILFVCAQLLIGLIIPLPIVVYRRQALGSGLGKFYKSVFFLFLRATVILMMVLASPALAIRMGADLGPSDPFSRPNQQRYYNPNPQPYAPTTPQPAYNPVPSDPVAVPAPAAIPAPSNSLVIAAETNSHLMSLAFQIVNYIGKHQQVPQTLDELGNDNFVGRLRISPFDPSMGNSAYVYLPENCMANNGGVVLYDAAELAKTDSAHVLMLGPGRRIQTKLMSRADLSTQAGVSIPAAGN